jgi:hypothetical protein
MSVASSSDSARDERRKAWHQQVEKRKRKIAAFRIRNGKTRELINLQDMAAWFAQEGEPEGHASEFARMEAFEDLGQAIYNGEFGEVLVYFSPYTTREVMTREWFIAQAAPAVAPTIAMLADILRWVWVPPDAARRWFKRQGRTPPPELFQGGSPRSGRKNKVGRPTEREQIREALDALLSEGHDLHNISVKSVLRLVWDYCGTTPGMRGWVDVTVERHIHAWRLDASSEQTSK